MSTENNKAAVRHFYDEVINKKNMAAIETFIASNQVDHFAPPDAPSGIAGAKIILGMFLTAFPDLHFAIEDMIADEDKVVTRIAISGTQQGAFMGIPPTNKHVQITGIDINRVVNNQSVEHWMQIDMLGMMQQLGVIPV